MSATTAAWLMVGLDVSAIFYTLWVLSLAKLQLVWRWRIGGAMFAWLMVLHVGLSSQSIFPQHISGVNFLAIIFGYVGVVGALLLLFPPLRRIVIHLDQQYLLLFQGIRVFFGAGFLTMASLGILPQVFGILDGWTHISAGFFGLIAAYSLAANADGHRRAWFANIFGLVDILIVASTLALILLPELTPHHSMMYAVFLPAPLWLWFHVISIWKLVTTNSNHFISKTEV
jgi:hypothetical protein